MNETILLIEDNESIIMGLEYLLTEEQYTFLAAKTKKEAQDLLASRQVDLVLLDVSLPDGNGFDLCRKIKEHDIAPVIFLTAKDEEKDVVLGFDLGADDYVTKPFSMSVLVSKISAMLKRTEKAVSNIVQTGKLTFYIDEKRVVKGDNAISITPTDWKLLMAFIEHPHHILSRKQLLERLWDSNTDYVDENAVAVNIRRLREKIEPDPSNPVYIKNVRGLGYVWEMECERQ